MSLKINALIVGILFFQCSKKEQTAEQVQSLPFESKPVMSTISPGFIDEASGITASLSHPGHLWVQQDGGNPAEIVLINEKGLIKKRLLLKTAYNRDWEDLSSGAGPIKDSNYLYIAETGDNSQSHYSYSIFRFKEPHPGTDTIFQFEKINFRYPDGSHDAEAIFVSKQADIYIITKRDSVSKIYKLPYPQNTATTVTAIAVGKLAFTKVTGAAYSGADNEILIKTYNNIYYWKLSENELPEMVLSRKPTELGYEAEPQGEAICFHANNLGFYTLSEKPFYVSAVALNFYKRK